ncbi:hypothetical protein B0H66DRAFT_565440 [Apodospora peruviana]|uniref:Uncharacterized protein n=1 Tax=Apodospora peruviana TaxID=516989 RepID=A0AAE0HZ01_9PEZI|nr:hypothetical protein B0H66DRAFT_565440 [Apodospora peruviana]
MANPNRDTWDIHSALNRNPSTATDMTSMFSQDYFAHRFGSSRMSIASSVAGPPPLSPRADRDRGGAVSAGPSPISGTPFNHLRQFSTSPWPISSAPSSPAPAPPPPVIQTNNLRPRSGTTDRGVSPIVSPRTPVQQQQQQQQNNRRPQSRGTMEQEFRQKHTQLVDQAKVLLAEMQTLQVLGPIHGSHNGNSHTSSHSDDGRSSQTQSQLQSDDASSLFSNTNSNANYEQDEAAISALNAMLAGRLGSVASKPPPRPARAVAREVVSRAYSIGESEALDLLMEDYETVLDWAKATTSSSSVAGHAQAVLNDRKVLLEAALPAQLAGLVDEAMMHFGHERLYSPPQPASIQNGTGAINGSGSSSIHNGGGRPGSRSPVPPFQQFYANSTTFRDNLPVEEIPRHRFMRTDDGYAWDMIELASELRNDIIAMPSTQSGTSLHLRNPMTKALFTATDVARIVAHPMGRGLAPPTPTSAPAPSQLEEEQHQGGLDLRRLSASPSPTPSSPMPLPEPVSSLSLPSPLPPYGSPAQGEYEDYNHRPYNYEQTQTDTETDAPPQNPMEMSWPTMPIPLNTASATPPPPPYVATTPPPPAVEPHVTTDMPEPLRLVTYPSSPAYAPPPPPPVQRRIVPEPAPLPGAYPIFSWEEREQEDEGFNATSRPGSGGFDLPVPVSFATTSPSFPGGLQQQQQPLPVPSTTPTPAPPSGGDGSGYLAPLNPFGSTRSMGSDSSSVGGGAPLRGSGSFQQLMLPYMRPLTLSSSGPSEQRGRVYPSTNPFASPSRDSSLNGGRIEVNAGPFELDNTTSGSGSGWSWRGLDNSSSGGGKQETDNDRDADSNEWMGDLASGHSTSEPARNGWTTVKREM